MSEITLEGLVERLKADHANPASDLHGFFDATTFIHISRAPGRLDVMGGIADYSGSLVLEMPIREATWVAMQRAEDEHIDVISTSSCGPMRRARFSLSQLLTTTKEPRPYDELRAELATKPDSHWASYVLGPLLVLMHEVGLRLDRGARIFITSDLPEGKGVSSSAALEVATMRALLSLTDTSLEDAHVAHLCQKAENLVAGAPCGVMDQMTSALGSEGQLLALLCQPAIVEGLVPIPNELAIWGIDSGIQHTITGSDYTAVRVGAFMGARLIAETAGLTITHLEPGRVAIDDPHWDGYLANITPDEFERQFAAHIPYTMVGADFLENYYGISDSVTDVNPDQTYAVYLPTYHPIRESHDSHQFRVLLQQAVTDDNCRALGTLMGNAHESYSACKLGSDGTDAIVEEVHALGFESGLIGAKITGGGSGGTVAILGRREARSELDVVMERYRDSSGLEPTLFEGSSSGACATPVVTVTLL